LGFIYIYSIASISAYTIRYDAKVEFNVDSKAERSA